MLKDKERVWEEEDRKLGTVSESHWKGCGSYVVRNPTVWAKGLGGLGGAELPGSPLQWKRWSWAWSRMCGIFWKHHRTSFGTRGSGYFRVSIKWRRWLWAPMTMTKSSSLWVQGPWEGSSSRCIAHVLHQNVSSSTRKHAPWRQRLLSLFSLKNLPYLKQYLALRKRWLNGSSLRKE